MLKQTQYRESLAKRTQMIFERDCFDFIEILVSPGQRCCRIEPAGKKNESGSHDFEAGASRPQLFRSTRADGTSALQHVNSAINYQRLSGHVRAIRRAEERNKLGNFFRFP